jgi:hypothetical protein
MNGFDLGNKDHLDFSSRVYGEMVEQDLLARLRNGAYGNGVELAKREEIYRIMFSRALAKQHTQLLFIPAEFMTYFALRFSKDGIGTSLLDEMKVLNSLRSMLLFANVMAGIKNSIGRTEVKLKFDEDDPNPEKSAENAIHEIIRSRQNFLPLGVNSPAEVVDFITRAGFEFTFEGHPGMPDVSVDFGEKNSNYVRPDTDLEDSLRKRAIMKTGIPPETVDAAWQPELATSVVTNNILMSKRVMQIQDEFHPQLASHMRIHAMNSEELMSDLTEILRENFSKLRLTNDDRDDAKKKSSPSRQQKAGVPIVDEKKGGPSFTEAQKEFLIQQVLREFLMNVEVSLPRPNSSTLENQVTALETYVKALDMALDAWLSEKFFTSDTGGDVAGKIEVLKETAKAYYVRQWMSENGMLTELAQLTTTGEDGQPVVDVFKIQADHIEQLQKTFGDFFKSLVPATNRANDKYQAAIKKSNTQEGGSSYSSDTDSSSSGGTDDLGFGGGDNGDGSGSAGGGDDLNGGMPDFGGGGGETDTNETDTGSDNSTETGSSDENSNSNLNGEPNDTNDEEKESKPEDNKSSEEDKDKDEDKEKEDEKDKDKDADKKDGASPSI